MVVDPGPAPVTVKSKVADPWAATDAGFPAEAETVATAELPEVGVIVGLDGVPWLFWTVTAKM